MLYKAVVYMVLLYGSEIWVMTRAILKVLEVFCHLVVRRISGNMDRSTVDGEWECPPVADSLETSWLWPIKGYIQRQQATIVVHIDFRIIY